MESRYDAKRLGRRNAESWTDLTPAFAVTVGFEAGSGESRQAPRNRVSQVASDPASIKAPPTTIHGDSRLKAFC